jgi:hypothetical protein
MSDPTPSFFNRVVCNDSSRKGIAAVIAGALVSVISETLWPSSEAWPPLDERKAVLAPAGRCLRSVSAAAQPLGLVAGAWAGWRGRAAREGGHGR